MFNKIIISLTLMFLISTVGYLIVDSAPSGPTELIKTNDVVSDTISSIQHRAKMVVTDANIRAETIDHTDGTFYYAEVSSYMTARVQVFIDLSKVDNSWVKRSGQDLHISVPKSAITYEVIQTSSNDTGNHSWIFQFDNGIYHQLVDKNHNTLHTELNTDANTIHLENIDLAAAQIGRLFSATLTPYGYHVTTSIDMDK